MKQKTKYVTPEVTLWELQGDVIMASGGTLGTDNVIGGNDIDWLGEKE